MAEKELPRYPEVEKAIIEILKSKNGISDYSTLHRLLPDISDKEFYISTHYLNKDGIIKEGTLEEIAALVQCDENTLVEAPGLSRSIILIEK